MDKVKKIEYQHNELLQSLGNVSEELSSIKIEVFALKDCAEGLGDKIQVVTGTLESLKSSKGKEPIWQSPTVLKLSL